MVINPVVQTDTIGTVTQADVTNTNQNQSADEKTQLATKHQTAATDTVTISDAAKKIAQEATETTTQTANEARHGDRQAKRLLAKEAAAEELKEPPNVKSQEAKGINI